MPSRNPSEGALRESVAALLRGGSAHATLDQALRGLPLALAGKRPSGSPHSAWELSEHLRIAAWDIVEFSRNRNHVSPEFPAGYWPNSLSPPSAAAWARSRRDCLRHRDEMIALIRHPKRDVMAPLPHAGDKTLLREALVLADHNAYHIGQLVLLRRRLGVWAG